MNWKKDYDGKGLNEKEGSERECDNREGMLQEPSAAEAYLQSAGQDHPGREPRIPEGGGHTAEEYYALPEDLRVELIDGVFYDMASPARIHQVVSLEVAEQLDACLKEHGEPCLLLIAPSDLILGEDGRTVVQPDLYVYCGISGKNGPDARKKAPDFVVEVLSQSNPGNDLWRKRMLYQRHGVREYWIVDPHESRIFVYIFDRKEKDLPPGRITFRKEEELLPKKDAFRKEEELLPKKDAFRKGEKILPKKDAFQKEEKILPNKYTFRDVVPVHVSGGTCRVDFTRLAGKLGLLRKLEQELT